MNTTLPSRVANLSEAQRLYPELTPRMGHWLKQADPLADRLVESTHEWRPGRLFEEVDEAVRQGLRSTTPTQLHELLEYTSTIPAWVDFERINRGGAFFLSTHLIGGNCAWRPFIDSGIRGARGQQTACVERAS